MTVIEQLATKMGFSLQQLAGYLDISKSQLHMAKQGQRQLPARQYQALQALQREMEAVQIPARPALQPDEQAKLRRRLHHTQHQYLVVRRRLQQLEERYALLYRQQQWIALQLQRGAGLTPRQQLWLELQQLTVQRRLRLTGAMAIVQAQTQLQALGSAVLVLEEVLR